MPSGDKRNRYKNRWIRAVESTGHEVVMVELKTISSEEDWKLEESRIISTMIGAGAKLTNGTAGGEGGAMVGWAREKMLLTRKSTIYRNAQSARLTGRKHSESHRRNNQAAQQKLAHWHSVRQKGKKFSLEHIKNITASARTKEGRTYRSLARKREWDSMEPEARAIKVQKMLDAKNTKRVLAGLKPLRKHK